MTTIRQRLSNSARWVSAHVRVSSLIVAIPIAVGIQVWSIYDSIPDLPKGALQMVGVSDDGARFVELDDRGYATGSNRVSVLVVFDKLMHVEQGAFRFEVKRELIDCAKKQIELQGAGFYDDQERRTISRVFDQKPKPFEPVDTETMLVCDHAGFGQPRVVGFRAALAQTRATVSRVFVVH